MFTARFIICKSVIIKMLKRVCLGKFYILPSVTCMPISYSALLLFYLNIIYPYIFLLLISLLFPVGISKICVVKNTVKHAENWMFIGTEYVINVYLEEGDCFRRISSRAYSNVTKGMAKHQQFGP